MARQGFTCPQCGEFESYVPVEARPSQGTTCPTCGEKAAWVPPRVYAHLLSRAVRRKHSYPQEWEGRKTPRVFGSVISKKEVGRDE